MTTAIVLGVVIGVGAAVVMKDVILGIAIGVGFIAVVTRFIKIWSGPTGRDDSSPSARSSV